MKIWNCSLLTNNNIKKQKYRGMFRPFSSINIAKQWLLQLSLNKEEIHFFLQSDFYSIAKKYVVVYTKLTIFLLYYLKVFHHYFWKHLFDYKHKFTNEIHVKSV